MSKSPFYKTGISRSPLYQTEGPGGDKNPEGEEVLKRKAAEKANNSPGGKQYESDLLYPGTTVFCDQPGNKNHAKCQ
tara:strand:- start:1782 stop:2012 length:231 start_codon:yes stop_codon:yes gene_type:complete